MKKNNYTLFGLSELDLWHHVVLILILITSLFAFMLISFSKPLQIVVGVITAILYVAWGVIHHYYDGDLHFKNVIEYFLIAILGIITLIGALL